MLIAALLSQESDIGPSYVIPSSCIRLLNRAHTPYVPSFNTLHLL